jgi:hypothetical protein
VPAPVGEHRTGGPLPELAHAITSGAVRLAAATAAWLRLIAEFDERGGWHGVGILSCGHWLSWQCGLSPGAAREHVRVARALRDLPRIETAFAEGRLSYSKVRAMTRIATPDCEESLLELALEVTASQVERFCRQWRRSERANAGAEPPEFGQSFEYWKDDEGMVTLKVRMPAEAGAALMTAIDSLAERAARRERAQAERARARHDAVRADGGTVDRDLVERCAEDEAVGLARERTAARRITALTALAEARADVDRRAGDPPRREMVVHVDADVLAGDETAGRAYLDGGWPLTPARARRMLCEATVVVMLEKNREPLAVGRKKRRATRAQRRALLRRDGGCARPGCPETRIERLHAHHLRHWLFGGRTDLANLVLLCDADHGLVHDHDLVMTRRDGRLIVTGPDGRRVWGTADAAFAGGLAALGGDRSAGQEAFAGVHPIDTETGRRPAAAPRPAPRATRPSGGRPGVGERTGTGGERPGGVRRPAGRPSLRSHPARRTPFDRNAARSPAAQIRTALFPDGEPPLPDAMNDGYARMSIAWAVDVLMSNRELTRRLAAEAGVTVPG